MAYAFEWKNYTEKAALPVQAGWRSDGQVAVKTDASMDVKKYDYIDALRGFAVLGVILVHSSQWISPSSPILSRIATEGARGVQLFFVASALTLFLSMAARSHAEEKPVLRFYVRRFFRIAPAFYCAILVYTVCEGLSARYWAPSGLQWWYIPLTAFFLHGWHPETITSVVPGGWSIAVEVTFYLLAPFLFLKLSSIRLAAVALLASILASQLLGRMAIFVLAHYYPADRQYLAASFVFMWFFSQLPIFIVGILLYHFIKKWPNCDRRVAPLILAASFLPAYCATKIYFLSSVVPGHIFYGLTFALFSLYLHYSPQALFVNVFTVLIGRLSFSMYLTHFMVLNRVKYFFSEGFPLSGDTGFVAAFALVLCLSICISCLTYRAIEVPGIKLGKRIVQRI